MSTKPPKRVYIQYQPDSAGLEQLQSLQQAVGAGGAPVHYSELHMTMIHFGIVEPVYMQIRKQNPRLSFVSFVSLLDSFIEEAEQACPNRLTVMLTKTQNFGSAGRILVGLVKIDDNLRQAHHHCLTALQRMLKDCGIAEPTTWMAANHNFRYALTFKPHISLLKDVSASTNQTLDVPIALHLSPTRYDLKKKL